MQIRCQSIKNKYQGYQFGTSLVGVERINRMEEENNSGSDYTMSVIFCTPSFIIIIKYATFLFSLYLLEKREVKI